MNYTEHLAQSCDHLAAAIGELQAMAVDESESIPARSAASMLLTRASSLHADMTQYHNALVESAQ